MRLRAVVVKGQQDIFISVELLIPGGHSIVQKLLKGFTLYIYWYIYMPVSYIMQSFIYSRDWALGGDKSWVKLPW